MSDNRTVRFFRRRGLWSTTSVVIACSLALVGQTLLGTAGLDGSSALKVDVSLVPVHVVVRDPQGRAIEHLTKDDFQVFDQGKPQVIRQFSAERASGAVSNVAGTAGSTASPEDRFTIYLFDDLHLQHEDLVRAREEANRQITHLASFPWEHAALYTTSGQSHVDFDAGTEKLRAAVAHLEPKGRPSASDCPHMTYYMADLIEDKGDREALSIAADEIVSCAFDGNGKHRHEASKMASGVAREKIAVGKAETANSLGILKRLIRVMSSAPGRKLVVLVSPGFFVPDTLAQAEITDLAARSDVNLSVLDPRGLLLPAPSLDRQNVAYLTTAEIEDATILEALTDATGGVFFRNNNDVEEGFRRIASVSDYSYTLAFSPQDLKFDGHFHKLKVTVNNSENFAVQARKGYYAPKKP